MVGNQTNRYVLLFVLLVFGVSQLADLIPERSYGIHVKDGIHVLHHACQTLQTHTGINVLLLQLGIVVVAVVVKLGKYVVPDLHIAIAVAAYGTARLATAILLASVIIDFRAGAAGTCAVLPEVVLLAKPEDSVCRNADFLIPDIERLVVLQVNGRI